MGEALSVGIYVCLFITLYFEVFLLITLLEARPLATMRAHAARQPKRYPSVTVIVPCYNEERTVEKTLHSLLSLNYPRHKLTIMAIDDGSTDATWAAMQRFAGHRQISLYKKENGGKHTALNLALSHTRSELVGCLDADSTVAPDALREIVKGFEDPTVMAVTPAIQPSSSRTLIELIQKAEYALSITMRRAFAHLNGIFITPGPFSLFRRSVFERIGTYRSAHNTEDLEFGLRMQANHMKIGNAPTAHVFTNTPRTVRALFRQRLRWTYGYLMNSSEYRYIFFNPTYGHLGMFVLPIASLAIVTSLYLTAALLYLAFARVAQKFVEIGAVGLRPPNFSLTFDWFYLNTSASIFLVVSILVVTITLTVLGKRLSGQSLRFPIDILAYLICYGFLAPWWLTRALYNAARGTPTSWTAERT